jgi:FkbM family methyltransferase
MVSTATKMRMARAASKTLLALGFAANRRIRRAGIVFDVDLREGIDLSLFLFGTFQRQVLRAVRRLVPADGVVIDVGANIGAIALPVAAHVARGHVYAFEPTDLAYGKLAQNLALNPQLAERLTLIKSFVADEEADRSRIVAYSSWPVSDSPVDASHPIHRGVRGAASCGQITLDGFVRNRRLSSLSLIKIDTDGSEYEVLRGATEVLRALKPAVIFEACEYLMRSPRPTFDEIEDLLRKSDYEIRDAFGKRRITATQFYASCPQGGGLDLVAIPRRTG